MAEPFEAVDEWDERKAGVYAMREIIEVPSFG
jgi:hypothetical protein